MDSILDGGGLVVGGTTVVTVVDRLVVGDAVGFVTGLAVVGVAGAGGGVAHLCCGRS